MIWEYKLPPCMLRRLPQLVSRKAPTVSQIPTSHPKLAMASAPRRNLTLYGEPAQVDDALASISADDQAEMGPILPPVVYLEGKIESISNIEPCPRSLTSQSIGTISNIIECSVSSFVAI